MKALKVSSYILLAFGKQQATQHAPDALKSHHYQCTSSPCGTGSFISLRTITDIKFKKKKDRWKPNKTYPVLKCLYEQQNADRSDAFITSSRLLSHQDAQYLLDSSGYDSSMLVLGRRSRHRVRFTSPCLPVAHDRA